MLGRFRGDGGRRLLIEAIRRQRVSDGSEAVAEALANVAVLREVSAGEVLVEEGAADNGLHLVLAGRFSIRIKGREAAIREPGMHVGEMALIDPAEKRCGSAVALEAAVVATIAEPVFSEIAEAHPRMWRVLAVELATRLRQRNRFVSPPNPQPVLFVGSSSESIAITRAIESGLAHDDILVKPWTADVFSPSQFPIDDLVAIVRHADFAALVVSADDHVESRGVSWGAPRDNVIFELGLAMGQLDRDRALLIQDGNADLKIPSDLLGLTPLKYKVGPEGDITAALGPVVNEIRRLIEGKGCR